MLGYRLLEFVFGARVVEIGRESGRVEESLKRIMRLEL